MDVAQTLKELGVEYRTAGQSPHVTHGWLGVKCPWCDRGRGNFGCGVNLRTLKVSCWSCGGHSLTSVLVELGKISYEQAKGLLGDLSRPVGTVPKPRGRLVPPPGLVPLGECHRDYLSGRGIDPDAAERVWGLKGTGPGGKLQWRIYFPVMLEGEEVSWTTRAVGDRPGPKYVSAKPEEERVGLKTLLFGEDLVPGHAVVVNEGPLDAITIGPGAVATCGVGYSKAQVVRIARFPVRVIAFDNEPQAKRRALRLCDSLAGFPGETYMIEWSGKDASRSPAEEVEAVRRRFLT